jgi:hypothetical protein
VNAIDALFARADLRCSICNAKMGTCSCWKKCWCGLSVPKDEECRRRGEQHREIIAATCMCPDKGAARARVCAEARGNRSRCACACHRKRP